MRKINKYFSIYMLIIAFIVAGCSSTSNNSKELKKFTGEWDCAETTLEDEDMYTGYFTMRVEKNGDFSIYDKEAGNPGISGKMVVKSDSELILECDDEEFNPPADWLDMSEDQTITYEFVNDNELHLIYSDDKITSTLVFNKE